MEEYGLEQEIKEYCANFLLQDIVLEAKAKELGLDQLDEETADSLKEEAGDRLEQYITSASANYDADTYTEEEIRWMALEELEELGYTEETIYNGLSINHISDLLYAYSTEDVEVTEEDIEAYFEKLVEEQSAEYDDSDTAYNYARNNGETIVWNPEGYRQVKHVLILANEEVPEDEEEAAAVYAELEPTAQEVIDAFRDGEAFTDLIQEYGGDSGMVTEPTATIGYAVSADSDYWDSAFTEGAMSIENPGEISGMVYGAYGIYIIYYESDIASGPVELDSVYGEMETGALSEKKEETYYATVDQWVEESNPEYHYEVLE